MVFPFSEGGRPRRAGSRAWLLVLATVFLGGVLIGAAMRRDRTIEAPRPEPPLAEVPAELSPEAFVVLSVEMSDGNGSGEDVPVSWDRPFSADYEAPLSDEGLLSDEVSPERIEGEGLICVVIDDCGFNVEYPRRLVDLKIPMTFAILPRERRSLDVEALLRESEVPAILHLPLEAERDASGGPYLIGVAMSDDAIGETVTALLDEMPSLVGVNNHRGSRATADERVMRALLEPLAERDLLFLDSRTSSKSVAFRTAQEMGIQAAYNSVFLDHEADLSFMASQWERAQSLALRRGWVVVIGHVRPTTITFFETMDRRLRPGLRLVTLPELLEAVHPK